MSKRVHISILFIWPLIASGLLLNAQTVPISASVEMYKGKPTIMLNGKPRTPVLYALTDVPGGRWSWEEIPKHTIQTFCDVHINLIQVDLFFDHVWMKNDSINTDTAKKLLRGVLDACPDASIFLRFHVNPPLWWQGQHPEENTLYADTKAKKYHGSGIHRLIQDDEKTPERYSLASVKWKKEAMTHLKLFLHVLQQLPEANAIAGIQVAGGVYGEWHYWGFLENEPDISVQMTAYFRNFLKNKYGTEKDLRKAWKDATVQFQTATLPTLAERRTTQAGIFRQPELERKVIDYYQAQHSCVADDILDFCRVVKENWPRPIITGAFYGYFYSVFGREAAGGHLEPTKVLNSPYIDFLSGPHAYYPDSGAEPGDPYRSRSLINSVALHGKLWLDEMDIRPPLVPLSDSNFAYNLKKSIATTRQNMLFSYSKGMGLWFYDFGPSGMDPGKRTRDHGNWGWWDEPSLMKDIGQVKTIMDSNLESGYKNDADVLLVHDTKTFYYTASTKSGNSLEHWINNWIPVAIFRSGVVHDVIHIDDLERVNLNQYKAIVFVNDWVMNDSQKAFIRNKVAGHQRHLIFVYAPAYSDEHKPDVKFIKSLTGMSTEKISLQHLPAMQFSLSALKDQEGISIHPFTDPLFAITDKIAEPLGNYTDTSLVAFARKSSTDYTSWYMAWPDANPYLWRYIFKSAGAHVYDENGDIFYSGHGILSVHTREGGDRTIQLKDGKIISINLPPVSTTLLNPETGQLILQ